MRAIVSLILMTLLVQYVIANRICVSQKKNLDNFSKQNYENVIENDSMNNKDDAGYHKHNYIKFETCENFCYTLWKENKTGNDIEITIIMQGCWKQSGYQECGTKECVAFEQSTKALNNTKFCCCREDYCNINITNHEQQNKVIHPITTATDYSLRSNSKKWILITLTILSCALVIICSISVLICKINTKNRSHRLGNSVPYCDQYSDSSAFRTGTYTFDNLKLATIVGQGRYGSVWQGSIGDQDVAVKIFPAHYRNYFQNEKDTYCLPFMEHPSLLKYYGADERINLDGNIEYLLVLSFSTGGTLTDFLRSQTVDWSMFCKMSLSIVKGLAYLHTDHQKNGKMKPCIAHRDINSRNILIKVDGTCCICDLGLAVQISGSKYYLNGEEQHAETKSINDVGTLRYMAPEVLEGAVNLRDCESSLKQIDVYAIGLVLWEIVTRCSDIYVSASEIPTYKLPFEKEIGLHPTFEQMQILVSRNKARPLLEGNLVDKSGVRLIKETMEDCWDADAEARLTALCIEERLTELQSHRVTLYFADGSPMMNSHCGLVPSTTNSLYNETHQLTHHAFQDANDNVDVNLVTLSPIDNITYEHCKNSNEMVLCSHTQTLQPYQGRNPCMERNLMVQSNSMEQLACNGNIFIDKSSKHASCDQYRSTTAETQVLIPQDYLAQNASQGLQMRPATPIPYVQNVISENGGPSYNKLKQTNVYESCTTQPSPRKKGFGGWSSFKKLLSNSSKLYSHGKCQIDREDSKSNLLMKQKVPSKVETNVTLSSRGKYVNEISSASSASFLDKNDKNMSQTTTTTTTTNEKCDNDNVPARPSTLPLVPLKSKKSDNNLIRQKSINKFNQVFNVGSSVNILKDPNMRIKTPGDLPPSVRKIRGRNSSQSAARFSLYDDRIMCNILNEQDNQSDKTMSNSVPYGMDLDCDTKTLPPKLNAKDITCF